MLGRTGKSRQKARDAPDLLYLREERGVEPPAPLRRAPAAARSGRSASKRERSATHSCSFCLAQADVGRARCTQRPVTRDTGERARARATRRVQSSASAKRGKRRLWHACCTSAAAWRAATSHGATRAAPVGRKQSGPTPCAEARACCWMRSVFRASLVGPPGWGGPHPAECLCSMLRPPSGRMLPRHCKMLSR